MDINPTKLRRVSLGIVCGVVISVAIGYLVRYILFTQARAETTNEWAEKMPDSPRSMADVRGILESIRTDDVHPAFVPHSAWDNAVCAGNIISAVNFILGTELLTQSSAWMFHEVNAEHIALLYNREHDFAIENGHIVERYNRGFGFDGILDMVGRGEDQNVGRVYVVGYHYQQTSADPAIIRDRKNGGTLNSHLMLLLGTEGGRWYGYHLFHDPEAPEENPFSVFDMGSCGPVSRSCMPNRFDLMYIWEIRTEQLPVEGAPIRLEQRSASYQEVIDVVGEDIGGRRDHIRDTIATGRAELGDHFPTVVRRE